MQWLNYKSNFINSAKEYGYNDDYLETCLNYAQNLWDQGLPVIYSQLHLAQLVGYELHYLLGASNQTHSYYRYFEIDKKSGGKRNISEPLPSLKEIQRWILDSILYKIEPSPNAKAYIPGRSIKDNARFHRKQNTVLSVDILDFFGSIKFKQVYTTFCSLGYSFPVSMLLAKLSTLRGCLPQGAPTSAAISNIICIGIDEKFRELTLDKRIRYTRYADDITFSGDVDPAIFIPMISKVLLEHGFRMNKKKTKVMKRHQRQVVTGIVVNSKMQVPKETRRLLRQNLYFIEKFGLESHLENRRITRSHYVNHLMGLLNHTLFVNPQDKSALKGMALLKTYLPSH